MPRHEINKIAILFDIKDNLDCNPCYIMRKRSIKKARDFFFCYKYRPNDTYRYTSLIAIRNLPYNVVCKFIYPRAKNYYIKRRHGITIYGDYTFWQLSDFQRFHIFHMPETSYIIAIPSSRHVLTLPIDYLYKTVPNFLIKYPQYTLLLDFNIKVQDYSPSRHHLEDILSILSGHYYIQSEPTLINNLSNLLFNKTVDICKLEKLINENFRSLLPYYEKTINQYKIIRIAKYKGINGIEEICNVVNRENYITRTEVGYILNLPLTDHHINMLFDKISRFINAYCNNTEYLFRSHPLLYKNLSAECLKKYFNADWFVLYKYKGIKKNSLLLDIFSDCNDNYVKTHTKFIEYKYYGYCIINTTLTLEKIESIIGHVDLYHYKKKIIKNPTLTFELISQIFQLDNYKYCISLTDWRYWFLNKSRDGNYLYTPEQVMSIMDKYDYYPSYLGKREDLPIQYVLQCYDYKKYICKNIYLTADVMIKYGIKPNVKQLKYNLFHLHPSYKRQHRYSMEI